MTAIPAKASKPTLAQRTRRLAKQYWKYRYLMMLLIPSVVMLIIFKYVPMYGVTIAFKDFKLRKGIMGTKELPDVIRLIKKKISSRKKKEGAK